MEVNNLVDSLNTLLANFLGSNFSELKFKYDIPANFKNGSSNKYGVRPSDITNANGATCFLTVDQIYEVVLTDTYVTVNNDDVSKDTVTRELKDLGLNLYVDILNRKAGLPTTVMNIRDMTSTIEDETEDKVLVNTLSFTIQYRKPLG